MVYCGKPSKGCQPCRDKKTRCDKTTPSCGQCIRAKRTCPGYRNELDLMFRNESEAVVVKAKTRGTAKSRAKTPPSPKPVFRPLGFAAGEEELETEISEFLPLIVQNQQMELAYAFSNAHSEIGQRDMLLEFADPYSMFPTVDELSLGYFQTTSPHWLRNYDLIDSLCNQTSTDPHLLACVRAVGLASFANSVHALDLLPRARKDYVKALNLTNAALRSPTEAKKDTTLFSVVILSVFEALTGNNERSLAAWTEHINGAGALVNLRGKDQFKTIAGQRMFFQVVSNLMLSCIQRTTRMPAYIVQLREEAKKHIEPRNPAWQLSEVIIDFTSFRADVKECQLVGPRTIINKGLEIDKRFIEVFTDLPKEWHYKVCYTDKDPHLVWNSTYHVYTDFWIAHLYNGMRTCRIMLHETIRDQLLAASTAITPIYTPQEIDEQAEKSVQIMIQMRSDILASVPQHFPELTTSVRPSLLEGARSYFVLWPLYLCGGMDITTEPIRVWVTARLRDIGEKAGIRQALVVAEHLEKRKNPESWNTKPDLAPREKTARTTEVEEVHEVPSPRDLGEWIESNMQTRRSERVESSADGGGSSMDDYSMGDSELFQVADMNGPEIGPVQYRNDYV